MASEGRTVLVTGSTDGVGRYVASRLAADGAHVLVHGRDRARGERLVEDIGRRGRGSAEFHQADFASLAQVRELARAIQAHHRRLDLLVNNAGIGRGPPGSGRETSAEGYELRFAVNYLAGFLLTRLLLPLLTASAPARIVNVASAGQHPIDFADVMLTRDYDGWRAYMQSKLAQILFTFDLAHELAGSGVTVNALHPATYMATHMVREIGITPASTVEQGGDAILHLATAPDVEGTTGGYFDGMTPARAEPQAYDAAARTRLRTLSFELTGLASA
jgi:NAD(P)-dependent dehydrogenase (short-subunit alcohol dehydrogenase family)